MRDADYNEANKIFRHWTMQQTLLAKKAVEFTKDYEKISITSYGAGFGMFESEFINLSSFKEVEFIGIDVNKDALRLLKNSLALNKTVKKFEVKHDSTERYLLSSINPPTNLGLSVHSLYYHGQRDVEDIIGEMYAQHDRLFIALTPLNALNQSFHDLLSADGVEPVFSEDLDEILNFWGAPFKKERINAEIKIPEWIDEKELRWFVGYVRHDFPETDWDGLIDHLESFGAVFDGEFWTIPQPVDVFTIVKTI